MKRATQRLIDRYEIETSCKFYKVLKREEGTEHYHEIPVCSAPSKKLAFSNLLTSKPCQKCRSKRK